MTFKEKVIRFHFSLNSVKYYYIICPNYMSKKINTNEYENWSKEELVKEIVKIKSTTYGLVWHRDLPEAKIDILVNPDARTPNEMFPNEMAGKPFPVLKEVKGKAIESDKSKFVNLLIEGDNYHSLVVLNFTHHEAIDLIYIDPPYNTGNNDFIYNDRYVDREDSFRHSKWLTFMEKRLKLAKNLLKKSGAIFISIDENEYAPLRMLCDEIFEENNFVANLIWKSKSGGANDSRFFAVDHEYVLVYEKSSEDLKLNLDNEAEVTTVYNLNDEKGRYSLDRLDKQSLGYLPSLDFPIKGPDGKIYKVFHKDQKNKIARWRWGAKTVKERYDELVFKNGSVYTKNYEKEGSIPRSLLVDERFGRTRTGKTELFSLFGKEVFQNPKPPKLIKHFIGLVGSKNSIILDFMAGSGTTGQAVLELNNEDGGKRNFILCTNNELNGLNQELEAKGLSKKEIEEHGICRRITYPRLEKIIKGYKNQKGDKIEGLGGNLKYYKTDFVEAEPTDKNKRKLVKESTDMLCILENAFGLILETPEFKIFKNTDKYVGIIFYEEAIDAYKKAIKKINGHFNTYVFSMNDLVHKERFANVIDKVKLCAIPDVILKVYREIFK
jgi:adenine-specific DNA-methyltransferase